MQPGNQKHRQGNSSGRASADPASGVTRRGFLAASALAGGTAATAGLVDTARALDVDETAESATGGDTEGGAVDEEATGEPDLESRVEELVVDSLEEYDIPGASVAVVRDGAVTMVEGYGEADREEGTPVEATTPFRVGSVSKPVVWTALARLVKRGELDPEVPVAEYLDDPPGWGEPVTLAQLATHTAGFEVTNRSMWYSDPADVKPLPEHLDPMPAQVRPPGGVGSYSNHGVALAGQVLAAATGEPFPDAVADELLEPAGMETGSFRQPLPDDLYEAHATGHGGDADGKFAGLGIAPAGALSASAADMARFMELHLNDGVVDGEQVLDPDTVDLVARQWFTHHEALAGMAFGFVEDSCGDVRILRHAGGTPLDEFWCELRLVPEFGFGLFLAYNAPGGAEAVGEVPDAVIEELAPEPDREVLEPDGEPERAAELGGTYRSLRRGKRAHDSLATTLNADTVEVRVADDGALVLDGGEETRWVEIEPLVFQHAETGERIAFGERNGGVGYLFFGGTPTAFERIPWYESTTTQLLAAAVALVGVGSGWVLWSPSREDGESRREWLRSVRSNRRRLSKLVLHGASSAFALFVILALWYLAFDFDGVFTEPTLLFRSLFALSILGAVAAVGAAALGVLVWRDRYWTRRKRLHYSFVALSLLVATAFLWYWNLLLPP